MSLSFNKAPTRATPIRATPTRARVHPSYLPLSWSIVWLSTVSTGILARLVSGFHLFLQVERVASSLGITTLRNDVRMRHYGCHMGCNLRTIRSLCPVGFLISAITILCYIFFSSASQRYSALATALLSVGLLSWLVFYWTSVTQFARFCGLGILCGIVCSPTGTTQSCSPKAR